MPQLVLMPRGKGKAQIFPLFKKITTIGSAEENDVILDQAGIEPCHAHILFDGSDFVLSEANRNCEVLVNGRRRKSHKLGDQDSVRVGPAQMTFSLFDEVIDELGPSDDTAGQQALAAMEKLESFSERLFDTYDVDKLLEQFMDDVIELSGADKGFMILLNKDEPVVRVARNIERKTLDSNAVAFSDSIVQKVLASKRPIIVSDALHDQEFSGSTSIINLRLCSVMAVPLLSKGNMLGLIYVGNDNIVNLFRPYQLDVLRVFASQAALIIANAILVNELKLDKLRLEGELEDLRYGAIIGSCVAMREIYTKIDKVASTDISVLIEGETGTGKELIAREIHERSDRARGPFVTINCGAIPENLLESELFGHVRGAFTGAVATTVGKFQAADKGTLFLDEVGEMPLNLQVKLLRAIQEKQITRVGESRGIDIDIRIVAATNKILIQEAREGRFREDLYYRLNVVKVGLPRLHERGNDVEQIALYLLKKYTKELGSKIKGFTKDTFKSMKRYEWPGNIRELENRIKKAIVFADTPMITPELMDFESQFVKEILPLADAKDEFQKNYINEVLQLNNGNRTKTAKDLDVDPRTIFRHLEKERD
ncbi:MAG TPA: GAF domain-containing protein [Myxococcales bacterium]|nr:GAF domain-containing protein [Myxococcales bacterium]